MSHADLPPGLDRVIDRAAPLVERFTEAGHRLFFVGGVVRDHLLDRRRDEQDLDATTDARPPKIKALVADLADAVWTQGERFGTIGCTIGAQTYEITTHRADSYDADSRKPTVAFGERIEDDLARRDFTVNAMAVDLVSRAIVDPHDGTADLANGVLRTPLDPHIAFSDDPLRMLRAARFHAGYGLQPTPDLIAAIESMVDRMEIVSAERVRDEMQKILLLDDPGSALALLASTGLLAVVLPSLAHLDGDSARGLGTRVAAVIAEPAARWAAVLSRGGTDAGAVDREALRALKFSGDLSRDVVWLASAVRWADDPPTDRPALRRAATMAPSGQRLETQLAWLTALRGADGAPTDDLAVAAERLASLRSEDPDVGEPPALLTGEAVCALLGIAPGRDVGVALRWLRDLRMAEGPISVDDAAQRLLEWWPSRDSRGGDS